MMLSCRDGLRRCEFSQTGCERMETRSAVALTAALDCFLNSTCSHVQPAARSVVLAIIAVHVPFVELEYLLPRTVRINIILYSTGTVLATRNNRTIVHRINKD